MSLCLNKKSYFLLSKSVYSFSQIHSMKKILLLNTLFVALLSISCSKAPQLDPLREKLNTHNLDVSLSGRYWQSLYTPSCSFELKFTNNSDTPLENCLILINDQFKHELNGLKVKMNNEKTYSVTVNSMIKGKESVSIMFDQECGNIDKFKINTNVFFKPKTITLISNTDTIQWLFDVPLRKSYF
jgi:hypothetical protein